MPCLPPCPNVSLLPHATDEEPSDMGQQARGAQLLLIHDKTVSREYILSLSVVTSAQVCAQNLNGHKFTAEENKFLDRF